MAQAAEIRGVTRQTIYANLHKFESLAVLGESETQKGSLVILRSEVENMK